MRIILILLSLIHIAHAQPKVSFEKVVRYSNNVNGNRIEITIHQGIYDFTKHKIAKEVIDKNEFIREAKVDNVNFAGTEGLSPFGVNTQSFELITINKIELIWNGVKIKVPKNLHINLIGLTLRADCIQFIPRPSGEEILIQATGGDGGASFLTSIVLRRNGKHKQYENGYWEGGLRPHPYIIEEITGTDDKGRIIVNQLNWLEPKMENKSLKAMDTKKKHTSNSNDWNQELWQGNRLTSEQPFPGKVIGIASSWVGYELLLEEIGVDKPRYCYTNIATTFSLNYTLTTKQASANLLINAPKSKWLMLPKAILISEFNYEEGGHKLGKNYGGEDLLLQVISSKQDKELSRAATSQLIANLQKRNRSLVYIALRTLEQNNLSFAGVEKIDYDSAYAGSKALIDEVITQVRKYPKSKLNKLDQSLEYQSKIYSPIWLNNDWK